MTLVLADPLTRPAPPRAANRDWLRALEMTARLESSPRRTLPVAIEELAARQGGAPALLSDAERLSFADLAARARRYARWAMDQELAKGDVVALLMPNRPEYLAIWLGLTRVGIVVALVNPELRGASLAHCVKIAAPRHIIVDARLETALTQALDGAAAPTIWRHGEGGGDGIRIDLAVEALPDAPLAQPPAVTLADPALLIYTSGTTGLPKAARVSHHRIMSWSGWFAGLADIGPADRLYDCLPLCHSAGGVAAVGAALVGGASAVIVERFSAHRFWDDVVRWDCTLFQYIGELCRYLLAAPEHRKERAHSLRLCCGNGLSADVWTAFQDRFAIPRILEFYAATEGAFSLYNVEGKPGAVGRLPPFLKHRFPAAIVRFDADRGEPARDAGGRCIRCGPGEPGEAIGRISTGEGAGRFEGYTDDAESRSKVLRDVFAPGDAWFRTGDLMRTDAQGFFHFVERIGDTFRWKGENVSAAEVAEALRRHPGVREACVYGVEVPGASGRAGMAALVTDAGFDIAALPRTLESLPTYARPLFLRLVAGLEMTETFKPRKRALADDGYDPRRIADPLYLFDRRIGGYVALDRALFDRIGAGEVRL